MCPRRGNDPASGHPRAHQPPLGRGTSPPAWDGRLDAPGQRRRHLPSSAWTRRREVKQGKSGGSVGTTDQGKGKGRSVVRPMGTVAYRGKGQGKGKGRGEGRLGQGGRGRSKGGEKPMGTTAYGGKGSKGRAANGDRPVGAASCRPDHHTMASCQNPHPLACTTGTLLQAHTLHIPGPEGDGPSTTSICRPPLAVRILSASAAAPISEADCTWNVTTRCSPTVSGPAGPLTPPPPDLVQLRIAVFCEDTRRSIPLHRVPSGGVFSGSLRGGGGYGWMDECILRGLLQGVFQRGPSQRPSRGGGAFGGSVLQVGVLGGGFFVGLLNPRVQRTMKSSKHNVRIGVFIGHAVRYLRNSVPKPGT